MIDKFLREGCDCQIGTQGMPCYTLFTREYYENLRAQCQELDSSTLDMVIMGYLLGSLSASTEVTSHRPSKKRERQRTLYQHRGHKVYIHVHLRPP